MNVVKQGGTVTLIGDRGVLSRRDDGSYVLAVDGGAGTVRVFSIDVSDEVWRSLPGPVMDDDERAAALARLERYTRARVPEQRRAGRD